MIPQNSFRALGYSTARLVPALVSAVLLLGGCDTVRGATSAVVDFPSKVGSTVGGWFAPTGDGDAAAADPELIVLPLADTEWAGRKAVAEELARALRAASPRVRMGDRADGRSQTLVGRIETLEAGGPVAWIEVRWMHYRGDGRLLAEYRQMAAMDRDLWDKAAPAGVRLLAVEIAPKIAAALREGGPSLAYRAPAPAKEGTASMEIASNVPTAAPPPMSSASAAVYENTPQAAPPPAPVRDIAAAPVAPVQGSPLSAAWTNPIILVRSVEGAPGDGNVSLMLGIKQALKVRDFMVTEDPRQAVFQVDGQVEISPPANGRQRAKLTWTVTTVSGGQVGRAVQENTIPAGTLNGTWGQVAALVANAAADGVEELFGRPASRRAHRAAPPPTPLLPLVPGRAPPPPR